MMRGAAAIAGVNNLSARLAWCLFEATIRLLYVLKHLGIEHTPRGRFLALLRLSVLCSLYGQ
jgi:hypothetical protein